MKGASLVNYSPPLNRNSRSRSGSRGAEAAEAAEASENSWSWSGSRAAEATFRNPFRTFRNDSFSILPGNCLGRAHPELHRFRISEHPELHRFRAF